MRRSGWGIACCLLAAWSVSAATPVVGAPAAEITVDQLLTDHANLSALTGRAVVLEFWSTSCAFCVSAIPHLNELAAAFKDRPVVFLSVTEDDRATVEGFLKKHFIAGWVGIAKKTALFKIYGVEGLPRLFLIDAQGKVAGDIYPWMLNAEILEDLAAGRALRIPKMPNLTISRGGDVSGPKPVFDAILRPAADPTVRGSRSTAMSGNRMFRMEGENTPLERILATAFHIPKTRIVGEFAGDRGLYDYSVYVLGGASSQTFRAMFQAVVCATLSVQAKKETREMDVLLLTAPNGVPASLEKAPESSLGMSDAGIDRGVLRLANAPLATLAQILEDELGRPVIDETHITGYYNLQLAYRQDAPGTLEEAIRELGFKLESGRRKIELLSVARAD